MQKLKFRPLIKLRDGYQHVTSNAYLFKHGGHDYFIARHPAYKSSGWSAYELTTGLAVTQQPSSTRKGAIKQALDCIAEATKQHPISYFVAQFEPVNV